MGAVAVDFGDETAAVARALEEIRGAVGRAIERAKTTDPGTAQTAADSLLQLAEQISVAERTGHGLFLQLLAQVAALRGKRANLTPWITRTLETSPGRARSLAEAARAVGSDPALSKDLSTGRISQDGTRLLTRTVKAVKGKEIDRDKAVSASLQTLRTDGVSAATQQVHALELTVDPGLAEALLARQRKASFLRCRELPGSDGMVHVEGLFDPIRGAAVRATIEAATGAYLRERELDNNDRLPADVRDPEQINAEVLHQVIGFFTKAEADVRELSFTPPTLFYAPATHQQPANSPSPTTMQNPATSEQAPGPQTPPDMALTLRDLHCTYPGCDQPPAWSLHTHHVLPFSEGGKTTPENLRPVCSEHHTLILQELRQANPANTDTAPTTDHGLAA